MSSPDSGIDPDFPAPADHALNMDPQGLGWGCWRLLRVKVQERRGFGALSGLFSGLSLCHRDEGGSGGGTLWIILQGVGFILGFVWIQYYISNIIYPLYITYNWIYIQYQYLWLLHPKCPRPDWTRLGSTWFAANETSF